MHTPSTVVVSGLPRSGTSLMMRMLGAGGLPLLVDSSRTADSFNPDGYHEYAPIRHLGRGGAWPEDAAGRAVKVVFPLIRHLPSAFRGVVLVMRRSLIEIARSQAEMLGRRGDEEITRIIRLSASTLEASRAWLWARPRIPVLEVHYEALCAAPDSQCRRIAAFLDRPMDIEAMKACVRPPRMREGAGGFVGGVAEEDADGAADDAAVEDAG